MAAAYVGRLAWQALPEGSTNSTGQHSQAESCCCCCSAQHSCQASTGPGHDSARADARAHALLYVQGKRLHQRSHGRDRSSPLMHKQAQLLCKQSPCSCCVSSIPGVCMQALSWRRKMCCQERLAASMAAQPMNMKALLPMAQMAHISCPRLSPRQASLTAEVQPGGADRQCVTPCNAGSPKQLALTVAAGQVCVPLCGFCQ